MQKTNNSRTIEHSKYVTPKRPTTVGQSNTLKYVTPKTNQGQHHSGSNYVVYITGVGTWFCVKGANILHTGSLKVPIGSMTASVACKIPDKPYVNYLLDDANRH
jgi:hypothetical protein